MRANIYLNARFAGWRVTGVGRFGRELSARLVPLLAGSGKFRPLVIAPGNPALANLADLRPLSRQSLVAATLWEQLVLPFRARDGYLVNLGNTAPLLRKRQLAVVHDASVFAVPDNYSLAFRSWYRVVLHSILRRAAQVVTDSAFSRGELSRYCGVPPERIRVIHCGCDHLDGVAAEPEILERAGLARGRYVLAVGTPSRAKNLAVLVKAMERSRDNALELALVGEMEERVFNVNRIAWPSWVRVLGNVSDGQLKALYGNALCFAFPSRYEGFGLPPLEAMRCGCPTIVSTAASLPEVCGDASLFADPDDVDSIARHIRALAASEEMRVAYRARGYAQAERFTWDAAAEAYRCLIESAA
ncbi:MAG TPA: glycosyltransferase family 1 protein [Burkholderiales bacterium]|nr:glycosyltransferase family 1 protein [Burkholderiales bacterium]